MRVSRVICPFCGCGCAIDLYVDEQDNIESVSPVNNHPVSRGALCVKGWHAHEFLRHPQRLNTPIIKTGGLAREATWNEAMVHVAEGLLRIKEKFGPDSIGFLCSAKASNEENYLLMKLARAGIGTNNVDHCARL
jgi:predicted molibdopterin-dependent oxidoreductase YjgC